MRRKKLSFGILVGSKLEKSDRQEVKFWQPLASTRRHSFLSTPHRTDSTQFKAVWPRNSQPQISIYILYLVCFFSVLFFWVFINGTSLLNCIFLIFFLYFAPHFFSVYSATNWLFGPLKVMHSTRWLSVRQGELGSPSAITLLDMDRVQSASVERGFIRQGWWIITN